MDGHTKNNNKPRLPLKPKPPPPTATATVSFGGCFGCSGRNSVAIIKVAAPDPNHHHHIQKKQKPWFPNWSMKNPPSSAAAVAEPIPPLHSSSPAKEAEITNSTNYKDDHRKSTDSPKSKFIKWKTNCKKSHHHHHTPAAVAEDTKVISTAGEVAPLPTPVQTPRIGSSEKDEIVAPNGTVSENQADVEPSKSGTCKKRLSFCRKRVENGDKPKTGSSSSQPGSPVSRPIPNPQAQNGSVGPVISRSTTFPAPDLHQVQPIVIAAVKNNNNNNKISPVKPTAAAGGGRRKEKREEGKTLDSVVGLSIITVTLVIMVVWGRFCAIVCTAAWLYFVPRLRTSLSEVKVKANRGGNSGSTYKRDDWELGGSGLAGSDPPDLDSVVYKRRVVLEGLLERNRRTVA